MPTESQEANSRAIALRAEGRLHEAVAAFAEAIVRFPTKPELYHNLGMTLDEMGASAEALQAYEGALLRAPGMEAALAAKGNLLLREGKISEAQETFEQLLRREPTSVAAHLGLYELLQIAGQRAAALVHQRQALDQQRLYAHVAPQARRSVLALCAPGDWQANVPIDFLFDRKTTSLYKLYPRENDFTIADLPDYDIVFNAIAESDAAVDYLNGAQAFIDAQPRPAINQSARILATGRAALPATLVPVDCTVVAARRVVRETFARESAAEFPLIVRPVGSHAGAHLARIASGDERAAYLNDTAAGEFFVSPFFDYASPDGYFRKYRIVYVDGEPYPVHMAISRRWMIHYYNAPMAEHAWMRAEEAAFMADWRTCFGDALGRAVEAVGRAVGLEYFGIDCAIGPDGRLLVFEADPAMLVHTSDPVELFPYKHEFVPRIFRALERMVDRRRADT